MTEYPYTFENWPRTKDNEPILTCSEQAIYFAHLASDKLDVCELLTRLRKRAYNDIMEQRSKDHPNYQMMMDLAFNAQLYRECLEEITRINDSKYEL